MDYRRNRRPPDSIIIQGQEVERVDSSKCLGVHINNKPDWSHNTDALYRKGQSLRRLRSFNVRTELLQTFYPSVVASVIFSAVVCCGTNKLNNLVRKVALRWGWNWTEWRR